MAPGKHHRLGLVGLLMLIGLLLPGCVFPFQTGAPSVRSTTTEVPMLTDPSEILALAGLTLPPGVTDVQATTKPLTGVLKNYQYAYTVSWNGTIDTTNEFLAQTGRTLENMWPCTNSSLRGLYEMNIDYIPDGSLRIPTTFKPSYGYGNLNILVEGPDFTTVYVSVAGLPK